MSSPWTGPFSTEGSSGYFLYYYLFREISVFHANIVDPDQTSHSAASDLGLLVANIPFMGC